MAPVLTPARQPWRASRNSRPEARMVDPVAVLQSREAPSTSTVVISPMHSTFQLMDEHVDAFTIAADCDGPIDHLFYPTRTGQGR